MLKITDPFLNQKFYTRGGVVSTGGKHFITGIARDGHKMSFKEARPEEYERDITEYKKIYRPLALRMIGEQKISQNSKSITRQLLDKYEDIIIEIGEDDDELRTVVYLEYLNLYTLYLKSTQ